MSTTAVPPTSAPTHVPAEWTAAARGASDAAHTRDVSLDVLRGLAMSILVVNHLRIESLLGHVTSAALSAAEVLIAVSGVVVGMVFGRRWVTIGARATTAMLLRRSRTLYLASVTVVALVGALSLVPGLATEALTLVPHAQPPRDVYEFDGAPRTLLAVLTLEAGPWQFNILGFFIAVLAIAPAVLWALQRGCWPVVLAASWALYALGRGWDVQVLPSQSERPFPLLVWQLLFVHGLVLGWHRRGVAAFAVRWRRPVAPILVVGGVAFAALQVGGAALVEPSAWTRWEAQHFDKRTLDIVRVLAMLSIAATLYLALQRHPRLAHGAVGRLLLPLGRNSFYVFIMHVFVCLAVASTLPERDGLGLVGNTLVQVACVAALHAMVRHRFLFRWVPR